MASLGFRIVVAVFPAALPMWELLCLFNGFITLADGFCMVADKVAHLGVTLPFEKVVRFRRVFVSFVGVVARAGVSLPCQWLR